jgi:hypothetical protein
MDAIWLLVAAVVGAVTWLVVARWVLPRLGIKAG